MKEILRKQRGAAAIFIVVFFAILISVIALSFLRIAVQDQQQATNNDLSQSAFDSANGGLEDAKRALSWYNAHCPLNTAPTPADAPKCNVYTAAFTTPAPNNRCNIVDIIRNASDTLPNTAITSGSNSEVKIKTNVAPGANDEKLEQAYTCVTITTRTSDYRDEAHNGKNDTLIPLRTVDSDNDGNADPIDKIELNWFTNRSPNPYTPTYKDSVSKPLPASNTDWEGGGGPLPPIMRFQLIPTLKGNIDINNVNIDSKTVFLYPSTSGSGVVPLSAVDPGRTDNPPIASEKAIAPSLARCQATVNSGEFACSATIEALPLATGGSPVTTEYYLRIASIYNNADYQIRLLGSGGEVRLFNNVAPEIDATGRANDVFRRIQSRVRSLTSSNPITDGGFDITQGVCKNFNVPVYSTSCADALVKP